MGLNELFPQCKTSSPIFQKWILDQINLGNFEHQLVPIVINGYEYFVSKDALKINGVRINVSDQTQQSIANVLGLKLMTQSIMDHRFLNSNMHRPAILPIADTLDQMINSSELINTLSPKDEIVACSKTWIYNKWKNKATNYGFIINTNSNIYKGIKLSHTTIPTLMCIQPPSMCHKNTHTDYSQHALFYC